MQIASATNVIQYQVANSDPFMDVSYTSGGGLLFIFMTFILYGRVLLHLIEL